MVEEAGRVVADRLQKLEALRSGGIEPYAYRYEVTHSTIAARALFEAAETSQQLDEAGEAGPVRLGGRLVSLRSHGRTLFADLADRDGRIQLYFRSKDLGERFSLLDHLDIGDWLGVEGRVFRTRMGEVTVKVSGFELLAKSVRPLPFGKEEVDADTGERRVHHGFTDIEQRYRQRYADLAVHREVREVFVLRAKVVRWLRHFLDERGFLEVETPVLQPLYGGAAARPFVTHHNALDMPLYLRIADELYLKRLLVGGLERVYEIGHDFRNEGMDRTHNPEFTMLEFYQAYADYGDMMALTEAMVAGVVEHCLGTRSLQRYGTTLDFTPPFRRVSFIEGIRERAGLDLRTASDQEMRRVLLGRVEPAEA
ncbi:MAG TPA: amino acid--tRNA ligase-related protein, partial [Longimicrobiales bacterium]|nr:amino acid--tRNA ligase-related protein [Longimicrobiales bacterium]